jgi:N-acetylmuramoyl-L-alanine amidase
MTTENMQLGKGLKHRSSLVFLLVCATFLSGCVYRNVQRTTFRTVVIDPGHGGHDPGANPRGVGPEKIWTLQMGIRLQKRLQEGGFNAVLTRTTDVFIPLDARVAISNQQDNAVFVSVHFNYSWKRYIQGIETYYYSPRSADLAKLVHASILRIPGAYDRGIHTAAFHVIRRNTYPAILVEGGFLTNSAEARRIASPQYLNALTEGIYQGIVAYRGSEPGATAAAAGAAQRSQ